MKNEYFEKLEKAGAEWEAARKERQERKERIIEEFGWDSEELKAWYEEDKAAKYPQTPGTVKAYRAWKQSKQDEIEMSDFLWEREVEDFVKTLRAAGIETFTYTNQSTAAMGNLHDFAEAGCTMLGLTKITRKEAWGETEEVRGIRFAVN